MMMTYKARGRIQEGHLTITWEEAINRRGCEMETIAVLRVQDRLYGQTHGILLGYIFGTLAHHEVIYPHNLIEYIISPKTPFPD